MFKLPSALASWNTPEFENVFRQEVQSLDPVLLPLQAGLSQSSYVSDSPFNVIVLNRAETAESISVKSGIFYAGIIAGSCCADDPTPVCEQTEYCEVQFEINKLTADTTVTIVKN